MDLAPLNRWTEPVTAVPVESRTGPVIITQEYRVDKSNVTAFLNLMNERRRICRRDGARRWTLLRDLADPVVWIERYHFPTWLDYIRTSQRRTQADADLGRRLRALMLDGHIPVVRRRIERETGSYTADDNPSPRELADPMTDPTRAQ